VGTDLSFRGLGQKIGSGLGAGHDIMQWMVNVFSSVLCFFAFAFILVPDDFCSLIFCFFG
jgi:hypothetical protein